MEPGRPHVAMSAAPAAGAAHSAGYDNSAPEARPAKTLTYEKIAPSVKRAQYAVRGEIYLAAQERIKAGKQVIFTNVGNPHGLGQQPLTFLRQVMALVTAPFLLKHPTVHEMFPPDAIKRAEKYLANVKGGIGAYSDSKGNELVRQEIANFIEKRDGFPADMNQIFITNGASEGVRTIMRTIIRGPHDGIMVPVPQYPLYSASIALYDGSFVGYPLIEEDGWALDIEQMQKSLDDAVNSGLCVRGLVFINPGNPTGQVLSRENLEGLIRFCVSNRLVLLADEVYQENVYQARHKFVSAKKVMNEMGAPYSSQLELISFHTVSKGVYGECGLRGGYLEMTNIEPRTMEEVYKVCSINLSPNLPGQIALGIMCNPPQPGDHSYEQHMKEMHGLLESLKRRALTMTETFNRLPGIDCQMTEGALYSFPKITLPKGAMDAAKRAGKAPDVFYCLRLLEETGISTVPGSGFGQADGTFHFRTTILPPESTIKSFTDSFAKFHNAFMAEYSGSASSQSNFGHARL